MALVAGGIGATPLHSLLGSLLRLREENHGGIAATGASDGVRLQRVHVVLVARTLPELGIFANTLYQVSQSNLRAEAAAAGPSFVMVSERASVSFAVR